MDKTKDCYIKEALEKLTEFEKAVVNARMLSRDLTMGDFLLKLIQSLRAGLELWKI